MNTFFGLVCWKKFAKNSMKKIEIIKYCKILKKIKNKCYDLEMYKKYWFFKLKNKP